MKMSCLISRKRALSVVIGSLFVLNAGFSAAHQKSTELGVVNFAISCEAKSQAAFEDALALLHHMMYKQAQKAFTAVSKSDPACVMPYWGIAMSAFHPLWPGKPVKQLTTNGVAAMKQLQGMKAPTPREKAYIDAVQAFYKGDDSVGYRARIKAWAVAQQAVYKQYPDDLDASALSGLAQLALAPKGDKTFAAQRAAGKQLESVRARAPMHPGGFHYLIHAYDSPPLAKLAEEASHSYGNLAPNVSHALHMPSHIFVRLGNWERTIYWNKRSAAAALNDADEVTGFAYAHAVDYRVYAHLQRGETDEAKQAVADALAIKNHQDKFAAAYGLSAAQSRLALEREDWARAAELLVRHPASFSWDQLAAVEAITHFARGVGAARSGDPATAAQSASALQGLHTKLEKANNKYWATLVNSQRHSVLAWASYAKGNSDEALALMTKAADIEDSVDKSPVTPSVVLPARELLGDMLVLANKPAEAIKAYDKALTKSPNRARSLRGAMQVARAAGQKEQAMQYEETLRTFTSLEAK